MVKQSAVGVDADSLMPIVTGATQGNFPCFDSAGKLVDSGYNDGDLGGAPASSSPWTAWPGTFTALPASSSTITLTQDVTATVGVGTPIKYTISGVVYYGIVTAITSNLLTIGGAPLGIVNVTSLSYGDPARVELISILIPGYYEDADCATLIETDLGVPFLWLKSTAYIVHFQVKTRVADSSSNGSATIIINGSNILGNTAVTLSDATWRTSDPTTQPITTSAYDVNFEEVIEISVFKGTGGNAQELAVEMVVVYP